MRSKFRWLLVAAMLCASLMQIGVHVAGANPWGAMATLGLPTWSSPYFSSPYWSSPYWSSPYWSSPYWSSPYWSTPGESDGEGEEPPTPMVMAFVDPDDWTPGSVTVTLLSTGDPTTLAYLVNGVGPSDYALPLLFTEEGLCLVEAWSADYTGAELPHAFVQVKIDSTEPSASCDATSAYAGRAEFSVIASDPLPFGVNVNSGVAGVSYRIGSATTVTAEGDSVEVTTTLEGAHALRYWATDGAGNSSTAGTTTFLVDGTEPTVTCDALPAYKSLADFTIEASDPVPAGVNAVSGLVALSYKVDTQTTRTVAGGSAEVTVAAEGTHTIRCWAEDGVGNRSEVVSRTFVVDRTPPAVACVEQDAGSTHFPNVVTLHLTSSDALSGLLGTYLRVDNGATQTALSATVAGWGSHTLRYWAIDNVGWETTRSFTFLIDDTIPPVTTSDLSGAVLVPGSTITLSAEDEAGGSGVAITRYAIDGGAPHTYAGGIVANTAGVHALTFWSEDVAGNRESTRSAEFQVGYSAGVSTGTSQTATTPEVEVEFEDVTGAGTLTVVPIDHNAPGSHDASATFRVVRGGYFDVSFSGTFSGFFIIRFHYDESQIAGREENLKLFHWKDNGWQDVTVPPVDTVNNVITGRWDSFSPFAVHDPDDTPPVTTTNVQNGATYTNSVSFSLSATDNGGTGVATTYYTLNGGAPTAYVAPFTLGLGTYSMSYWSSDVVGNLEATRSVGFTVASPSPPAPAPDPTPAPAPVVTPSITGHTLYTPATPSTVYYGRGFTIYNLLKPRHKAGISSVKYEGYRYESGRWVRRATWYGKNYNYSTYTKSIKTGAVLKLRGKWRARAVHTHTGYLPKYSGYRYFYVR